MFLPIAFFIAFLLIFLPHYITATTLIKRPVPFSPITFGTPSIPGSTEHSPLSGAPITPPEQRQRNEDSGGMAQSFVVGSLPFGDISGTCIVTIYPLQNGEFDRATRDVVKFTAGRIILDCISSFRPGHTEQRMGGLNIAGKTSSILSSFPSYPSLSPALTVYANQELAENLFDVPRLPRPLRYRSGVGQVNDPDILRYMKDNCNWPPSSSSPNGHDDTASSNFQLLCGDGGGADANANGDSGAGRDGDEGKAIQALREEMKKEVGQSMCTIAGGEGGCGDGVSCRETSWRGVVGQVLFGVESIAQSGICVFE
ncbi:MAG: hypothetical protein M1835_004297 [Candelina submexicana]|nr:MAG: hypothetical protein M1835_004297 [Candelina submexicana]